MAGAALLLSTPAEGFEKVVPLLLGVASVAILLPVGARADGERGRRRELLGLLAETVAIAAICVYGGYFGAAAGVLLLALLLRSGATTLAHANASKNVVLGVSNTVAAVVFAIVAPVQWAAVAALGARLPDRVAARPDRGAPRTRGTDAGGDRRRRSGAGRQARVGRLPLSAHTNGLSPWATRVPSSIRFSAEACSRSPASQLACPAR